MPTVAHSRRWRGGLVSIAVAVFILGGAHVASAAVFTASTTNDSGPGSFRRAINRANRGDGDTVRITASGTIQLQSELPHITEDMQVKGPGADRLTVRRDAGGDYRVFVVDGGVSALIKGLTVRNGQITSPVAAGGGIWNSGELVLRAVAVRGNAAVAVFSGFASARGGGIWNLGTMLIDRSVVNNNVAAAQGGLDFAQAFGGGIVNDGELTVRRSTVSGNEVAAASSFVAQAWGGGLYDDPAGTGSSLVAATFALNRADVGGNINGSEVLLQNTLVALPAAGGNCAGVLDSIGYNLDDDDTCELDQSTDQPAVNGAQLIKPLGDYGGPTKTHALWPASPAVDKGISVDLTTDQRGFLRPVNYPGIPPAAGGDGSDIGAFELRAP